MLESFQVAFNAVMPLLILLGIGWAAVRSGVTDRAFMNRLNTLNFKLFFPFLMFKNVYGAEPENLPSMALIIMGVVSLLAVVALLFILVPRIVPENPRRGTIIQAIFRSNFIIYGIPLTTFVFGEGKASVCGIMVMIMVSMFNILSVIVLEYFREGGKVRPGPLLLGIKLPVFLKEPVFALGSMASTLALVVLGANLQFAELKKNGRTVTAVLLIRLLLLPLVMVPLGWMIGLRGVELFLILMIYGTPVSTASYPMAQNMGGDGQLAGQLVFVSTVASLGTIFLFIFTMSRLGLLI